MRSLFAVDAGVDRVENEKGFANNMLYLVQHLKGDDIEAFGLGVASLRCWTARFLILRTYARDSARSMWEIGRPSQICRGKS